MKAPCWGKPNPDVLPQVGIGNGSIRERRAGFVTLEAKTGDIHQEATMLPIK
jgi:hypothetical protein